MTYRILTNNSSVSFVSGESSPWKSAAVNGTASTMSSHKKNRIALWSAVRHAPGLSSTWILLGKTQNTHNGKSLPQSSLAILKPDTIFRHVNRLFLSNDGNFRQQSKSKNRDPSDVSMARGRATFPDEEAFKDYLAKAGDSVEVRFPLCWFSTITMFV